MGSVSELDYENIINISDNLLPTTYQKPEEGDVDEYSLEELLFNLTCVDISFDPNHKNNLKYICELGVDPDNRLPEYPSNPKFIDSNDIVKDTSAGLISINLTRNALGVFNIPNEDINNLYAIDTDFNKDITPPIFTDGDEYISYRGYKPYNNVKISDKNSYYFYFGLNQGKTALHKYFETFGKKC